MGLGTQFPPVNTVSKTKCTMCHGLRNPHKLKLRRHIACLIGIDEYLTALPEAKPNGNIVEMEIEKNTFERYTKWME